MRLVRPIKSHAVQFFEGLLSAGQDPIDETVVNTFLYFVPSLVSSEDNEALLRPLGLEEAVQVQIKHSRTSRDKPNLTELLVLVYARAARA